MIEWWWLIPAGFVGMVVGFTLAAVLSKTGPDYE